MVHICPWKVNWWIEFFFLLADLLLIFDSYEIISNGFYTKTRNLSAREQALLKSIYGLSLPYELIRIDERARIGPPQGRFCYVSFHTINSWGPMSDVILVHEAMHVWQYAQAGAVYIPRALAAQRTELGYNYGGLEKLRRYPILSLYNYEQQADIMADAFCVMNNYRTSWSPGAGSESREVFQPFLETVRRERDESFGQIEQ